MADTVIEVNDLSYTYPDGTSALYEVNLVLYEGESLGVIGPNGAGKSTLLLHLNGVLRGKGEVKILGQAVNNGNLSFIRSKVGLVFQDPDSQLFMPTVFDDVSFGPLNMGFPRERIKQAVEEALRQVEMLGYDTRSPHHLSYGEKKRISLATVLSMYPEILVLDEPTSNLDLKRRRDLINFLRGIKLTKIIATHDLELVWSTCDRVCIMDKAKLIACGKAKSILSDKALLEEHSLELPTCLNI